MRDLVIALIGRKLLVIAAPVLALAIAATLVVLIAVMAISGQTVAMTAGCLDEAALVDDAGGATRVPIAGSWATTSEWGARRHPIRGDMSHHYGLDFTGDTAVVAAKGGVVAATPTTGGEGKQIVLDHGDQVKTKYKHLSARKVDAGDRVSVGTKIGVMGSTGSWSTGRHLHFEVWKHGSDIDPRTWLKVREREGTASDQKQAAADLTQDAVTLDRSRLADSRPVKSLRSKLPPSVADYGGKQLAHAATIVSVGRQMDLDARTITIGVMTAMGESSLKNVSHGDSAGPDSRGLFQQRANGAWGSLADRMNPQAAAKHFFAALVEVPGYRKLAPTIAAHRTQRNADPQHYAQYWSTAVKIVSALTDDPSLLEDLAVGEPTDGCDAVADAEKRDPNTGDAPKKPGAGGGSGPAIVAAARKHLGVAYSWGGGTTEGPTRGKRAGHSVDGSNTVGFDCSGLVLYAVHQATGITLGRTAGDQALDSRGTTVKRSFSAMKPGDVIAFSPSGAQKASAFEHDGIYVGSGKMIHAPQPGKSVEVVSLEGKYWQRQTWVIKRFRK